MRRVVVRGRVMGRAPTRVLARALLAGTFGAVLGLGGAAPAWAAPAPDAGPDDAGQGSQLGGYRAGASGAPVSVLLYEPVIPIPSEPQLELNLAYTRAALDTGPASALASTLWPGDAVGEGFGTLTGQEGQEYPVKATARHPGDQESGGEEAAPGSTMDAEAGERGARARTRVATVPPGTAVLATARSVTSTSTTELTEDGRSVTARAVARAGDLELLGGLIRVGVLRAESVATSDGDRGTADGGVRVAGLTVLGQPVELGPDGVPAPDGDGPDLPGPSGAELPDALEAAGLSFRVVPGDEQVEGAEASGTGSALVVSVDTKPLRRMLDGPLRPLADALPSDARAELAPVLNLAPRIDFVLGNMAATAAATPPPGVPAPSGDGDTGAGAGTGGGTSGGGGTTSAGSVGAETTPSGTEPGEQVEPPVVAGEARPPYSFGGIPAALVVGAAVGSVLAGFGLWYLGGRLLGGPFGGCELGSAHGVPNLREGGP